MTLVQFLLLSIIVVTLAFICVIIANYRDWNKYAASGGTKTATITWDLFRRIYELNPTAYEVNKQCIYRVYKTEEWPYYKRVYIRFKTIFDFIAAQKYFKDKKKQKKRKAKNAQEIAGMEKLRDLVQQDIDAIRAQADEEFKQAKQVTAATGQSLNVSTSPLRIFVDENGNYSIQRIDGTIVPLISQL